MERVIKFRTKLLSVVLIIVSIIIVRNYARIEVYILRTSPFDMKQNIQIMFYLITLFVYLYIYFVNRVIRIRSIDKKVELFNPYGSKRLRFEVVYIFIIHILFWYFLIKNSNVIFAIMLVTTSSSLSKILDKVYMSEEYFVLFNEKYYFKEIDNITNDALGLNLCLNIGSKRHWIKPQTLKVKKNILQKSEEKSISVIDWQGP